MIEHCTTRAGYEADERCESNEGASGDAFEVYEGLEILMNMKFDGS